LYNRFFRSSFSVVQPRYSAFFLSSLLLIWSGTSVAAGAASEARQLLERMSAALQELSYQGIFVYRRDEDLAAMKVIHLAHKEGERELLLTLTGEARETVRDSRRFGLMGQQVAGRLASVEGYYQLAPVSRDRVAGRDAKLIAVAPRDQFRYGYRLWVDEKTGLLLKSDLLGEQGRVLEQVMFTSIELLPEKEKQRLLAGSAGQASGAEERGAASAGRLKWTVATIPAGFQLITTRPTTPQGGVAHMIYSDGLASVSVFIESDMTANEKAFTGVSSMGAVNAYGNVVAGHQVTVVGEVPEITVKTIGQSIRYQGP
jgi:sigma-E factor negative regulatory protein RseB